MGSWIWESAHAPASAWMTSACARSSAAVGGRIGAVMFSSAHYCLHLASSGIGEPFSTMGFPFVNVTRTLVPSTNILEDCAKTDLGTQTLAYSSRLLPEGLWGE